MNSTPTNEPPTRDYLWEHLRSLPYFRAVLRAVEAREYAAFDLPAPVLDLGCGDGHFAAAAFAHPLDVGIDPWSGPVRQAAKRGSYRVVVQGNGDRLPFPDGYFSSAISNSVLEHIPELDAVLVEMARVLRPEAPFVFCVPNHNFLRNLSVAAGLERLHLQGPAEWYRRFFNRISRHYHCDPPEVWTQRLEQAGFCVERWWHYFSPQALHTLEWGHYFGLPSLFANRLFGRWILAPTRWNLALTHALVEPYYQEEREQPQGSYSFYVTRRNGG